MPAQRQRSDGFLRMSRGSCAANTVLKLSGKVYDKFVGPAICFDDEDVAFQAIVAGKIKKGQVQMTPRRPLLPSSVLSPFKFPVPVYFPCYPARDLGSSLLRGSHPHPLSFSPPLSYQSSASDIMSILVRHIHRPLRAPFLIFLVRLMSDPCKPWRSHLDHNVHSTVVITRLLLSSWRDFLTRILVLWPVRRPLPPRSW